MFLAIFSMYAVRISFQAKIHPRRFLYPISKMIIPKPKTPKKYSRKNRRPKIQTPEKETSGKQNPENQNPEFFSGFCFFWGFWLSGTSFPGLFFLGDFIFVFFRRGGGFRTIGVVLGFSGLSF